MASNSSMEYSDKLAERSTNKKWSLKRKLLVGGSIALILVIALAVGLGVGLTRHNDDSSDDSGSDSNSDGSSSGDNGSNSDSTPLPADPSGNVTDPDTNTEMWQPVVGMTWQYVLKWPLNSTLPNGTQVWDIDLFDNNRTIITGLQRNNARVICYFSAGSYENWRPDKNKFAASDLGHDLDGWPGEKWLNVSSPTVRSVMLSRLDMAVQKGCNAVDPDNMDGYDNENGLGLTKQQSIDYVKWLANAAHQRGLSMGLKNAGAIIPDVISAVQFSVNEQCVQYNECDTYAAFITAGKPVFHVEYPKGDTTNNNVNVNNDAKTKICSNQPANRFSTVIKNMILDLWKQTC